MKTLLPLALFLIPLCLPAAGSPVYPANPQSDGDAWIVAGARGLERLARGSGRSLWRILENEQLSEPILADGMVVAAGAEGVHAVQADSGRLLWHRALGGRAFSPVLQGEVLYLATRDGRLLAIDPGTGRTRWEAQPGRGWLYPPAVIGGTLVTGGQDGLVWGLDAETGQPRWQQEMGQELVYRPLAADGRQVIVTTFAGVVASLDSATGRRRWVRRFPTPGLNGRVVSGTLWLGSLGGMLRALDLDTGRLLWQRSLSAPLAAPVMVRGGELLAVTRDGGYRLLERDTGRRLAGGLIPGEPVGGTLPAGGGAVIFMQRRNEPGVRPVLISEPGSGRGVEWMRRSSPGRGEDQAKRVTGADSL